MSMKRMSWITFIFLPLVFVASLFGMNVDALAENSEGQLVAWWWYPVGSVILLVGVMAFWLVYKIYPIEDYMNKWFIDPVRRAADKRKQNNAPEQEGDSETTSTLEGNGVDSSDTRDLEKGLKSGDYMSGGKKSLRFWESRNGKGFEKVE